MTHPVNRLWTYLSLSFEYFSCQCSGNFFQSFFSTVNIFANRNGSPAAGCKQNQCQKGHFERTRLIGWIKTRKMSATWWLFGVKQYERGEYFARHESRNSDEWVHSSTSIATIKHKSRNINSLGAEDQFIYYSQHGTSTFYFILDNV